MSNNINIFVAGAKELKQERTCIKALANELSSKYQSRGINIIAQSYEHFKDDQKVYNAFIENETDIAIFIIDGGLGEKTKDEFFTATDSLSRVKHPEVIVFMRKQDQETPKMEDARKIVSTRLGDKYYVEYENLEELKQKAEDRIDKAALETSYTTGKRKLGIYKTLFLISLLFIAGRAAWYIFHKPPTSIMSETPNPPLIIENKVDSSLIVFAGGGTVRNFVSVKTDNRPNGNKIDIDKYPNSINIPLPSSSAWHILKEEAEQFKRSGRQKYYTICLSAGKMDEFSELNKPSDPKKPKIVEIRIGDDNSIVYISKDLYKKCLELNDETLKELKNGKITCKQLVTLMNKINNNELNATIYSTAKTSGTLRSYSDPIKANLGDSIAKIIHEYKVFYDHTQLDEINEDDFLLLGSEYYKIPGIENKCERLIFTNEKGDAIFKPIYLYFLAYKKDEYNINTGWEYYVGAPDKNGEPITSFLDELGLKLNTNSQEEQDAWKRLSSTGQLKSSDVFTFNTTIIESNKKRPRH